MTREDFENGSSTVENFFGWINARHAIWCKRNNDEPKPWTDDPIFLDYKFTNPFRELDRGTQTLRELLKLTKTDEEIVFTTLWYRFFNRDEHGQYWIKERHLPNLQELNAYIRGLVSQGVKVFTSAHMVAGVQFQDKHETYLFLLKHLQRELPELAKFLATCRSMEQAFYRVRKISMVGAFIGYELVCDFRFNLLYNATDILSWASVGPGAARGLKRLGMTPTCESMRELYNMREAYLSVDVFDAPVPFELREIEHSLCEFDKYERARTGIGRPRCRYNGRPDA